MSAELKLHARQFILAKQGHRICPDWQQTVLTQGWILSHDPGLQVTRDGDDLILGQCIASGTDGYLNSAGRFCVISYPWLIPDAAALLNLYIGQGRDGDFVTSSPALAAALAAPQRPARQLTWGGMNWHPMPGAPSGSLQRLLRDQMLDLSTFSIAHRPAARITPLADSTAALITFCAALQTTSRGLAAEGSLVLALTAGRDSRTLAAALLSSGIPFECITQSFPGVNMADIAVAARICRYLGVKHSVVGAQGVDAAANDLWRRHTLGSYSDADNNGLLTGDQYRFLTPEKIFIRGGLFEVGRRFYQQQFAGLDDRTVTGKAIFRRFEPTALDEDAAPSLDAWLDWRRSHEQGLDLVDSFYLDQRVGGWLASIEQALDLLPGRSFQPANALPVMRALVTPEIEDRQTGRLQHDAIGQMAPELLRFPLNPQPVLRRGKNLARRIYRSAKTRVAGFWGAGL
jgi:hypothetical protein